ncbi:hypothetical protein [Campylobacter geochelonis]|uniref:hypothetical protein n=1 Tax=Campylobacter geochelonis TaxID=1780362 RepID=UPI000AA17596|nr:hypothetical protein [Campylobacter geochelonis]
MPNATVIFDKTIGYFSGVGDERGGRIDKLSLYRLKKSIVAYCVADIDNKLSLC